MEFSEIELFTLRRFDCNHQMSLNLFIDLLYAWMDPRIRYS